MPRGEYTRAKRTAMQAVMWLVLLCAVGLAALIDRRVAPSTLSALGAARSAGPVHFKLPAGWMVIPRPRFEPLAVVRAVEPQRSLREPPRSITLYSEPLQINISPRDYLDQSGLADNIFGQSQVQTSPALLDGHEALLAEATFQIDTDQGTLTRSEILICAVFPNHQAVTLRLSRFGDFTPADTQLLDLVASSIHVDSGGPI